MIGITRAAQRQIDDLSDLYTEEKDRPEAAARLTDDLARARQQILADPLRGLPHSRPYPKLAAHGFRWVLVRAYWVAWAVADGRPVITNVLHASADIERRAIPTIDDVLDW